MDRRSLLSTTGRVAAVGTLAALAGCSGLFGTADDASNDSTTTLSPAPVSTTPESGGPDAPTPTAVPRDYDGWLDGVTNYDGRPVDLTNWETVTVRVGAEGNGGYFAFDPPAIVVAPGTTVRWKWTGEGGAHTVHADDGSFSTDATAESDEFFPYEFTEPGVYRYYCQPHRELDMKGIVEVVA